MGAEEKIPKIDKNNFTHGKKVQPTKQKTTHRRERDEKLYLGREAWAGARGPRWGCSLGGVGVAGNLGQHLPCRGWWLDNGYRRCQSTISRSEQTVK